MPFTFSHPAIVLPFSYLPKRYFSLTALVIGSLTPDFEYFLRIDVKSIYSHTIAGLFWFDLPLGLLIAYIFHNIVRDCLFDNLPTFLKSRLIVFKTFNWNNYFKENRLVVLISMLIGASSHLFWDSFTHKSGFFVELIPILTYKTEMCGIMIPVFKIFQHLSTLMGGLILFLTFYNLPKENKVVISNKSSYWIFFTFIVISFITIKLLVSNNIQIGNLIVTGISSVLIALIIVPILINYRIFIN